MRIRLRPAHGETALAELYARPHRHDCWPDHVVRVEETIRLGRELIEVTGFPDVIADLSCGDAVIARALAQDSPGAMPPAQPPRVVLGDLAPGYDLHGPIEVTLRQLAYAGLLICTETIEHLDDPDAVLALARTRAAALLLSTPAGEEGALNPEHYWSWNQADVGLMLVAAGWAPVLQRDASWAGEDGHPWAYQIWGCR